MGTKLAMERQLGQQDSSVIPISISAAYGGSAMVEGTPVSDLAALLSVIRHYSDGSSRPLSLAEFSLSGGTITVGDNPITVTDLQTGLQAVLVITGLPLMRQITTVMEDLSEGTSVSRPSSHIREGSCYQAVLAVPDSKELVSIRVTMGGADITAMAASIEAEANIEELIKAKGFEDCVAVINGELASIIVRSDGLLPSEIAQITEIVYEQAGILPTNLNIVEK
jgi:hypothetical protein